MCHSGGSADKRWVICGDFNDYRERIIIGGDFLAGFTFDPVSEPESSLDILLKHDFCENLVERRPVMDRWTLYHTRGPEERHLCQLDYILASPALARSNADAIPGYYPSWSAAPDHISAQAGGRTFPADGLGPSQGE